MYGNIIQAGPMRIIPELLMLWIIKCSLFTGATKVISLKLLVTTMKRRIYFRMKPIYRKESQSR